MIIMKGKLNIYYDEEGDLLEIGVGTHREGTFRNLGKGVFERIDTQTKEVIGIAIHGFRKRAHDLKDTPLSLPVTVELLK